jgi:hypothetical protein
LPLKITDTPIKPREVPFTGTSPVINSDSTDTATGTISGSTTFQIPSGTPDPSQILALRMTSITTPQTLNWVTTTGGFSSNGNIPLPTQTTGTNIEDHLIFKWNAPPVSRWVLIGTNMIPSAVQRHLTVIAATCLGASAVAELDLPSSNAPTANCITGSTNQHDATLDFADSANQSAEFPIQFPVGWTGTLDVDWWWLVTASGGSNAVNWNFAVICQTSGTTYDQSYPSPGTTVTTNVGATNAWVKSTQTSIPVAGCAAGSRGKVRVQRLVADTFTGTARLNMLFLTMRVIPQS